MDVRVGLWRRLSAKELMLLNCGVGEDSWESLGQQGDPISPFWRRSALGIRFFVFCLFVCLFVLIYLLRGCGEKGTLLHCWWECKLVQPPWRTVWRVLKKVEIELPYEPWDFFGRNDAKAEIPVLWPLHVKSWLVGKDSDARMDWGQEEKGTTEDEMAWWHHWLDGRESEWTPGVGDGQGGLACCDSWSRKELDTTEWLNWTELILRLWKVMICSH